MAEPDLLSALEELCAHRLVDERVEAGTVVYEFRHAVVRQTLYEAFGLQRARILHGAVAEAMEAHWEAAAPQHAPPFVAVLAALALAPLPLPSWLDALFLRLGDTLAPLALLSVGFQLRLAAVRERWRTLVTGLSFKLVAGPLAVLAVFAGIGDLDSPALQVAVFEAAMAPMIGGAIVATQHKLDPELTTLMVGVGIPLSFLTLPVWWYGLAVL